MKRYAPTILNQTEDFTKHQLQMMLCTIIDARRYLVPVGRYRVPTGADIGYRG
ncbi:hypothetical protein ACWWU1_12915 [Corynebacterium striatum]